MLYLCCLSVSAVQVGRMERFARPVKLAQCAPDDDDDDDDLLKKFFLTTSLISFRIFFAVKKQKLWICHVQTTLICR